MTQPSTPDPTDLQDAATEATAAKPRRRRPIVIIAGALTLLLAAGGTAAAAAHKQVGVDVDGTVQNVGTFAGDVAGALDAADIEVGEHDLVVPGPDESLTNGAEIVVRTAEQVTFMVDGEPTDLWTVGRTAGEALADVANSGRSVIMAASRSGGDRPELDLPLVEDGDVTFKVDGDEMTTAFDGTVGLIDALGQADIELGDLDSISVSAGTDGKPVVTITRISEDEVTTHEKVEFTSETRETDKRYKGEKGVVQAGKDGERTIVTWQRKVDDKVVDEKERSNEVTTKPVTKIVEVGTKKRPAPKPAPKPAASSSSPSSSASSSPSSSASSSPSSSAGGTAPAGVWAKLAACESGGNPGAVSASGTYHGLYQFSVATWRSVGGSGVPSQASAGEQTKRAKMLQARSGWGQWPVCSVKVGVR